MNQLRAKASFKVEILENGFLVTWDSSGYTALGPSKEPFQHGKFAFKTWEELTAHVEYAITDESRRDKHVDEK